LKNGQWEERYLAFSPQERLFLYGRWQEGIEPAVGLTPKDRDQFQRLENLFSEFRKSGSFTVPLELGLSSKFQDLDRMSFSQWLRQNGFDSRLLNWYMNYAAATITARSRAIRPPGPAFIIFLPRVRGKRPAHLAEGNGWITRRLLERVGENIRTSQMVHRITQNRRGASVFAGETEFQAEFVVFAALLFRSLSLEDFPRLRDFVYSPWLTANLTLDRYPESRGAEPSWDTVFLDSPTLGYVDAMHQSLRTHLDAPSGPFTGLSPKAHLCKPPALLEKDWAYWKEAILHDLERVHSTFARASPASTSCAWPRHDPPRRRCDFLRRAAPPEASEWPNPLCQLRPERHFHFRRGPIPRCRSRSKVLKATSRLTSEANTPLNGNTLSVTFPRQTTLTNQRRDRPVRLPKGIRTRLAKFQHPI